MKAVIFSLCGGPNLSQVFQEQKGDPREYVCTSGPGSRNCRGRVSGL
jgi:hypothetical protein